MTAADRVAEIRARVDAATRGPWEMFRYRTGGGRIHLSGDDGRKRTLIADMDGDPDSVATVYNEGDREFLFAARDDVPWLLDRLADAERRAVAAEAAVRAVKLVHCWTNEDGKRFVFADDLSAALAAPDQPSEAEGSWP